MDVLCPRILAIYDSLLWGFLFHPTGQKIKEVSNLFSSLIYKGSLSFRGYLNREWDIRGVLKSLLQITSIFSLSSRVRFLYFDIFLMISNKPKLTDSKYLWLHIYISLSAAYMSKYVSPHLWELIWSQIWQMMLFIFITLGVL